MGDQSPRLVCDLGALDRTELERHRNVARELGAVAQGIDELPDGYRFRLPADARFIRLAAEFISRERLCCPFVRFQLSVAEGAAPIEFQLTGPRGAKELLGKGLGLA